MYETEALCINKVYARLNILLVHTNIFLLQLRNLKIDLLKYCSPFAVYGFKNKEYGL